MLTDEQITDFQEIYFQTFGKRIDKKIAYDKANKLIYLLEIIYKNLNKKNELKS